MQPIELIKVHAFIEERIGPEFHDKKLAKLKSLTLDAILKRKNPYLFRAKGAITANDLIESVLDATASSGEETIFGNFLERVAIFVCGQRFWKLISGRAELYREMIEPLGMRAKERNDELVALRAKKLNLFTQTFLTDYCDKGVINWDKLIRYNSGEKPV